MKKVFISIIFLSLLLTFSIVGNAALLSPGISVIQKNVTMTKNGVAKNDVVFSAEDFSSAIGSEDIGSVKITSLPDVEKGVLKLGTVDVIPGEVIPSEKLSVLRFIPAEKGVAASFGFIPYESEYEKEFICVISMTEESLDIAPVTVSDELTDMAGITVFSVLPLSAARDDVTFSIESGASHGSVEILNSASGDYKYTPDSGFYGKDSFTFVAKDKNGNISNVSKVTVKVLKNEKNFVYSDMGDSELHFAAAMLAENDIMLGVNKDGVRSFNPDGKVTRSDFLIMAMDTAGISVREGETSFCDGDGFKPYEKKYIATAESLGIVVGIDTEEGRSFMPDRNITCGEAALIVCRIAALSGYDFIEKDVSASVMANEDYDAMSVLAGAGMIELSSATDELSRANTAKILYSMLKYNR